ncbi:hypothetical protein [Dyadobacter sp. 676]|uniref:Uncharacterized protein n=1 Tax=Dyadobacter sp. 676 TaxID=3088362 RepID=A0AAU8FD69_9BACT
MEHSPVALFQILYQDETLFRLEDRVVAEPTAAVPERAPVPVPVAIQPDTPSLPATPAIQALPPVPSSVMPAKSLTPEPAEKPDPAFPALKHKILVLTDEPRQQDMIVSEALFLDNILKAVGHSLETSDVLNFSFLPGQDARSVLSGKKTSFFISFGVPLIKLNLDLLLVPYTPKIVEGIWFLLVDPLVVIEADRNLKKRLWQALQKMFEMS